MIVEEYKCDSTLIRIDDNDVAIEEENEKFKKILLSLIIKKISRYYERNKNIWKSMLYI